MANALNPVTFARGIVAASGTSVVAVASDGATAAPMPDNCHTILITNPDAAIVGLAGIAVAPAALTFGINAVRIEPQSTVVLAVGTFSRRGFMDQVTVAGSGWVFDSIGGAVTLGITYLNLIGGLG